MPNPTPTHEEIATFLHKEQEGCEGPVKSVKKIWWKFWDKEMICQKCEEKVLSGPSNPPWLALIIIQLAASFVAGWYIGGLIF